MSRNDEEGGVYVVIGEGKNQAPIVLETEGRDSSREAAEKRARSCQWGLRVCVARLTFVSGNELLLSDMERLQPREIEIPF